MKKKEDIFDVLGAVAGEQLDRHGYSFLADQGYDTEGAERSSEKVKLIKNAMKARGETLVYNFKVNTDRGEIIFWYELLKNKQVIARSKAIKFIGTKKTSPIENN